MSYSGEAAEQVVKISMDGMEFALRIAGSGAKQVAAFLMAALQSDKANKQPKMKLSGKERLKTMLKSGRELKIFEIKNSDLEQFSKEAKRYGVVYCALHDRRGKPGDVVDIMAKVEDAPKINRIVERFEFMAVDRASIQSEVEQDTERPVMDINDTDKLMEDLAVDGAAKENVTEQLQLPVQEVPAANEVETDTSPFGRGRRKNPPSEKTSNEGLNYEKGISEQKESVREFLHESAARKKEEQAVVRDDKVVNQPKRQKANQHKQPQNIRRRKNKGNKGRN